MSKRKKHSDRLDNRPDKVRTKEIRIVGTKATIAQNDLATLMVNKIVKEMVDRGQIDPADKAYMTGLTAHLMADVKARFLK